MPRAPRPEILTFPDPFPGVLAFVGTRRVRAWKAPRSFEFHCPDKIDAAKVDEAAQHEADRENARAQSDDDIESAKSMAFSKDLEADEREDAAETLREVTAERLRTEVAFERKIAAARGGVVVCHGGTVRGPAGAWVVEEDGGYFVVGEKDCATVDAMRAALAGNPEALAAFDAKVKP